MANLFSVFINSVYGTAFLSAFTVSGYRHNAKFGSAIALLERSSFHLQKLAEVKLHTTYSYCHSELHKVPR